MNSPNEEGRVQPEIFLVSMPEVFQFCHVIFLSKCPTKFITEYMISTPSVYAVKDINGRTEGAQL